MKNISVEMLLQPESDLQECGPWAWASLGALSTTEEIVLLMQITMH